ncbi:uncharacterized protein LOC143022991 [Oratosquilla oratoria]|uniref:uncharacterized protein LOC143022991 n=1 Tax=Oratosquilla oratoria TaxID=337810 RepID=UPI003F75F0DD
MQKQQQKGFNAIGISADTRGCFVIYAPVCAPNQPLEYQVARHDTANITCQVDSVPDNVTFTWRFNTSGSLLELGEGRASSKGLTSVLPYTPASPGDYGLLLCSASNAIGNQLEPCVINVTAAKPPELLEGCNIRNQTSHSVLVTCTGVDTVFPSTFSMEVLTSEDLALVTKVSNSTPFFEATGLQPGTAYTLRVGVTSHMGDSEPIVLKAFTVKTAEKRMGISEPEEEEPLGLSPIVGVMVGAILALVLITAATIAAALRFCPTRRRQQRGAQLAGVDFMEVPTPKEVPSVAPHGTVGPPVGTTSTTLPQLRSDDRNPDLIPLKDECDYQLEELRVPPCQVGPPGQCRHTEVATLSRGGGMLGSSQWEAQDPCMHHHHHHPYHSLPPTSTIGSFLPPSSNCEMMTSGGVFSSRASLAGAAGGGGTGGDNVSCAGQGGPMTVAGPESLVGGMVIVSSCPAAYTTPVPTAAATPAPVYPCGTYGGGVVEGGSGVQSPLQYVGGGGSSNTSGSVTVGSTSPLLSQYPPPPEEYDVDTYRQESSV